MPRKRWARIPQRTHRLAHSSSTRLRSPPPATRPQLCARGQILRQSVSYTHAHNMRPPSASSNAHPDWTTTRPARPHAPWISRIRDFWSLSVRADRTAPKLTGTVDAIPPYLLPQLSTPQTPHAQNAACPSGPRSPRNSRFLVPVGPCRSDRSKTHRGCRCHPARPPPPLSTPQTPHAQNAAGPSNPGST